MGADIVGAGTETIRIHGVEKLTGTEHTIIPDRIEAGTFMISAAVTGGDVFVENVLKEHLRPVIAKLREMGVQIMEKEKGVRVKAPKQLLATAQKKIPHSRNPQWMQS